MKHEIFDSMKRQLNPSLQAQADLRQALSKPAKARAADSRRWTALAACACLMLTICGAVALQNDAPRQHSYTTVDGVFQPIVEQKNPIDGGGAESTTLTGNGEGGDQDAGMTPEELEQAMLDAGYTQEEIKEYQSVGYQMTWAKWWKFVHQQENSEGDAPFNLDTLKIFSQKELNAPGGELPGGATVGGDVPVQAGAEAYDRLMEGMGMMEENAEYPDWYGGAYIDASGGLTVLLVEDKDPGDKSLELQVLEWTGDAGVAFSSAKYSYAYLRGLMDQLDEQLSPLVKEGSWWINTTDNCIDVDILFPVDIKILTLLAELDPSDDAIRVNAYTEKTYQTQPLERKPGEDAPARVKLGEEPVPGGVMDTEPVPGGDVDGDPAGYSQPAHYDLLPLETPSIANEDDALAIEPVDPGTDLKDLPAETVAPAQSIDLPAFTPGEE